MPLCPVHQTEMMTKHPGKYFCTKFIGVGEPGAGDNGYCTQRITVKAAPAPRPAPAPSQPSLQPPASGSPRMHAALECLHAAAIFYAGRQVPLSEVMNAARAFYHEYAKPAFHGDLAAPITVDVAGGSPDFGNDPDSDIPF